VAHARKVLAASARTGPRECSRGQATRCARSRGARCFCACGGHNHGALTAQLDAFEVAGVEVPARPRRVRAALADAARRP
jgi:hypothetical protein